MQQVLILSWLGTYLLTWKLERFTKNNANLIGLFKKKITNVWPSYQLKLLGLFKLEYIS